MNQVKTLMNCSYPECSNLITVTIEQKREFKTVYFKKYGKQVDIYCCKVCQEKHLTDLSTSDFLKRGTLKNHDYALIIHGADVSKRIKDDGVHLLTGSPLELRAKCLFEYLQSLIPINKRRRMMSKDVKTFQSTILPDSLKPSRARDWVAAYDTMDKCKELFPDHILIGQFGVRTRYIEYIE